MGPLGIERAVSCSRNAMAPQILKTTLKTTGYWTYLILLTPYRIIFSPCLHPCLSLQHVHEWLVGRIRSSPRYHTNFCQFIYLSSLPRCRQVPHTFSYCFVSVRFFRYYFSFLQIYKILIYLYAIFLPQFKISVYIKDLFTWTNIKLCGLNSTNLCIWYEIYWFKILEL